MQPKPEIKLIIAGGRDFSHEYIMAHELGNLLGNELREYRVSIVSGMAKGADMYGHHLAKHIGLNTYEFPADWHTHGKRAGPLRNIQMGDFADGLLAFWDGRSRGTKHMIDYMTRLGKSVRVINY